MIFVTAGTLHFPFERLLRAIDELPGDEELVVQSRAPGMRPARARCVDDLPYEELAAEVRRARVVVCHAGVGSVLTALANDKRPVVFPRLQRYGEAVDDHQLSFGRRLAEAGLVTLVEDPAQLAAAVALPPAPLQHDGGANLLALDVRATLEQLVGYSR
jgi:UDP-N-acetylglucosamine transferase subunit ALG13